MRNTLASLVFCLAVLAANAQTVLYDLDDTVLAGTPGANTFLVATQGSLSESEGELTYTLANSGGVSYTVGYFDLTTLLNVGDYITISYVIDVSSATTFNATNQQFRVGLFNSGDSLLTANVAGTSSATLNAYDGYVATYRPGGVPDASNTFRERTGTDNTLWAGASYTTLSGAPTLTSPGTGDFSGSFTLTLVAGGIEVSSVVNGGVAQTVTDASGLLTSFDTFSFLGISGQNQPTLIFTELAITSNVPEPGTAVLVAGGLGLVLLRRRSRLN